MRLDELRQKSTELHRACEAYGAKRLRVFGSVARGEESTEIDIDILVELPVGYSLFKQRIPLTRRLAEITGQELDLIPEHELNPTLRDTVLAEAIDL
ncbi:MAG: nucleotidyltransferase domain-containing protein [Salinisphaeraceae bacterium]